MHCLHSFSFSFCLSPCLAVLPLSTRSVFCSQGYDLEMKWPQPFCQERLYTSATPQRAVETGLQAALFCLTSLILACSSFCSSWERHYDCSEIAAPISVVLETVELIKPIWPKDISRTRIAASLVFFLFCHLRCFKQQHAVSHTCLWRRKWRD